MKTKDAVVTYRLLQLLAERAWDAGEEEQLFRASGAVDAAMLARMEREEEEQQVM